MKTTMLDALEAGYLLALKIPHGRLRAQNQETLAMLRDVIARERGLEPQAVQDAFEEIALRQELDAAAMKFMRDLTA